MYWHIGSLYIFHIAGNIKYDETNSPDVGLIRDIRQCNINKFINEMQLVEWDSVTNKTDTQAAYSEFHRILCEKYNKCFPYRKLSKPYYNNKPWLTNALKDSTSNGSWCMGIKGEMSGTVCVTFTWYMYIYELFIAFVCFVVCSLL